MTLPRRSTAHGWAYVFPALAAMVALGAFFDADSILAAVLSFIILGACVLQARRPSGVVWALLLGFFVFYTSLVVSWFSVNETGRL